MKKIHWSAKLCLGLVILAVATFVAAYLMGMVLLLVIKQNPFDVKLATYYEYWYWYKDVPAYAKALKLGAIVGIVGPLIGGLAIASVAGAAKRSLHGDARFASPREIREAGLLGSTGVLLGKYQSQYLLFPGQQFVLLAAPTRSGKGVGVVIPNLLNYSDSVVVLDIKQENWDITAGYRAHHGQDVYLFNPLAADRRTHRWNPLSYIDKDPNFRVGDVLAIGFILFPATGKDVFWNDQARNLFLGLVLYLLETTELPCTIGEVLRQSSGKGKPIKEHISTLINDRETSERPLSDACIDALSRFISNSQDTLASILSSFNAPLIIWANPIVDAATSADDFDLNEVRKRRMTIYLGVLPNDLAQAQRIFNLFFSQLVNINTKELPQKNTQLKYSCLLLMDEFTALGKVEIIAKAVSYMAGYNLRLMPIIQSMSQLASVYGEQEARTFAVNHAAQILFAPREQKDANEYSEMLGYQTEKSRSTSRSRPAAFGKGDGSSSESVSDQKRALLLPQELKEIGLTKEIITLENVKPILAEKITYYNDPVFLQRLLPAPKAPRLNLDLHQAIVESRKRDIVPDDIELFEAAIGVDEGALARLAHDFSDLPAVDSADSSAEAVSALVDAFFDKLQPGLTESAIEMLPADDPSSMENKSALNAIDLALLDE